MPTYRNSWQLCKSHKDCRKCNKCVNDWKSKCSYHSHKAQALKFVVDSLLNDKSITINGLQEITTIKSRAYVRDNEGLIKKLPSKCGICFDSYTYGGDHNMCGLGCSHTVCLSCVNSIIKTNNKKCPYCKEDIKKVVSLYYE